MDGESPQQNTKNEDSVPKAKRTRELAYLN
jgi:hypothetical protein